MYYKIEEELYNRIKEITGIDYNKYGDFINSEAINNILKDLICETELLKEQVKKQKEVIDKAIELIKNKISTETYKHLKALYDDIDKIEEVWEVYEFDDLLEILKEME